MPRIVTQNWYTTHGEETQALGRMLGRRAQAGDCIACCGALGAGKTTFVQGFAAGLGVGDDYYVRSPTFTLMQAYYGRLPLYHFDFYRLVQADEVWDIGFEDYVEAGGVTIIEWADKFPELLPVSRLDIRITILDADKRCFQGSVADRSHTHYLGLES